MFTKDAWSALYSKVPPSDADIKAASQALKGIGEISPADANQLPREVIDRAEEALCDIVGFVTQNPGDPREQKWREHSDSIKQAPPPPSAKGTISAAGPASPVAPIALPARTGLRPSDLRKARVGSGEPTLSRVSVDPDRGQQGVLRKDPKAKGRDRGVKTRAAATRHETPAAQKKRLDAEAADRQRRLEEDACERHRRWIEQEEAYRRQLAIEAEADERKRLADLRVAAEKQRLDEEAQKRKEEHSLPPPPKPIWVPSRNIPLVTQRLLSSAPYLRYCKLIRDAYAKIRDPDSNVSQDGRTSLIDLLGKCKQMERDGEYLGSISAVHLAHLASALEQNKDLREPDWFQANYVTGRYDD